MALAEGKDRTAGAIIRTLDATQSAPPRLDRMLAEHDRVWLRYADLRATETAAFELPSDSEIREILLSLTGGMMRYDSGIDARAFADHEPIGVDQDE